MCYSSVGHDELRNIPQAVCSGSQVRIPEGAPRSVYGPFSFFLLRFTVFIYHVRRPFVRLLATDSEFAIRRSDTTNYAIYRKRYAVGPGFESLKVHQTNDRFCLSFLFLKHSFRKSNSQRIQTETGNEAFIRFSYPHNVL